MSTNKGMKFPIELYPVFGNRGKKHPNRKKQKKIVLICKTCGNVFEVYRCDKNRKFCSAACYNNSKKVKRIGLTCKICGKKFEVTESMKDQKYCSKECQYKGQIKRERIHRICPICKCSFKTTEDSSQKYCSHKCKYIGSRGKAILMKNRRSYKCEDNPNYGKKYSKEEFPNYGNRGKMGWNRGKSANPLDVNYHPGIANQAKSQTGRIAWNKDKSADPLDKNYHPGVAKIGEALKGRKPWNTDLTKETDIRVRKNVENSGKSIKKLWQNPNSIYNSDKTRKNMSIGTIKSWKRSEYREAYKKGQNAKPNKLEQYFDELTSKKIKYVGDFSLWIETERGTRNPDFIIQGQNKVIEIFGDHWHKGENPKDKIKEYAEVNWNCKVFWESEVYNDTERVIKETLEFIRE